MTRLVLFELFVTNLLVFEHQQKMTVFWTLRQWLTGALSLGVGVVSEHNSTIDSHDSTPPGHTQGSV